LKQPWDWIEDDLLKLINLGVKESIELDYKACDALAQTDGKKNEISSIGWADVRKPNISEHLHMLNFAFYETPTNA